MSISIVTWIMLAAAWIFGGAMGYSLRSYVSYRRRRLAERSIFQISGSPRRLVPAGNELHAPANVEAPPLVPSTARILS